MKRQKKTTTVERSNAKSNGVQHACISQAFRCVNEAFSPADEDGPKLSKAEMQRMVIRGIIMLGMMVVFLLSINYCASPKRWIML